MLKAQAEFHTQLSIHLPTVRSVGLELREAEESDRIACRLCVSTEVAQQCVGESVVRRVGIAARTETHVAGVDRAPVLVFAIANYYCASFERVTAVNPGEIIARLDIRGRRQQRGGGPVPTGEIRDGHLRDAIVKTTAAVEQLLVSKPICIALPGIAQRKDTLTIPGRIDLRFIDQSICDHPGMGHLITITGSETIIRDRGHVGSNESAEGIHQIVVVMDVTAIDAVLFIKAVIQPHQLLPKIEGIG